MATLLKLLTGDKTQGTRSSGGSGGGAPQHPVRQPSRWLRNTLVLILLVSAGLLAWQWNGLRARTRIGAAYAARNGCVCHLISRRDLKSCEADLAIAPLEGVAAMVSLSANDKTQTVTAGLPLLGHASAHYDADYGCRLDPWDD